MTVSVAATAVAKPPAQLIEAFRNAPTSRPGDNLAIHRALEMVGPGDAMVVDGGGDESRALVGEIMKTSRSGAVLRVTSSTVRSATWRRLPPAIFRALPAR